MSKEERSFWANPYLRMLASPLRYCTESNWRIPRDLLISLGTVGRVADPNATFVHPASLEHPRFRRRKGGLKHYILCSKTAIGHTLRVRVIQELHVLSKQIRRGDSAQGPPLFRRLTRKEWTEFKSQGALPVENAVAILVIPPVNTDPSTGQRPEPNHTSLPREEDIQPEPRTFQRQFPPSELRPVLRNDGWAEADELDILPRAQIPLYNGPPLFPSRSQRAALHSAVLRVLAAEHAATKRAQLPSTPVLSGHDKGSHAIVICSDETTLLRGDTVPLAIALWRLRLWETEVDETGPRDTPVDWITR
ncbi:uncharacterized protein BXZ73DRAFT_87684 [Epithele typhae]|uniref:uncharacterized protein n=1 Tax=Epithele typhae TaxID=378194 RepID=UPI00200778CC|nr:uncharacterized protein BXZ73DRAFT_87684 [Epithele typhae]KAH9943313.1 hypothetical protein BXZ73DRAFT_87684 [Epithele typhae]